MSLARSRLQRKDATQQVHGRGRGMKRCRTEGPEGFILFVGVAVLANNLMILARLLTKRSSRRPKAAR